MKILGMEIKGFRCLKDISIEFDESLTLIVGENDAGKSSLVDCIKVVTQGRPIELTDFSSGSNEMKLSVLINNMSFDKIYRIDDKTVVEEPLSVRPTPAYIQQIKEWLESEDTNFENQDQFDKLKEISRSFGIQVRANSRSDTLVANLLPVIEQIESDPNSAIPDAKFPDFNNIQLDGKQFENVSAFFKEVFLKERQSSLWDETVDETRTINDIVKNAIDVYAEDIASKLEESGIKDKIKVFLPTLTDIRIVPDYSQQDFNLDARVKFLENGGEIDLLKKGDGTKRRITMALLELKRDEILIESDSTTIYLLDEPDTHLHAKAQLELLDTLLEFSEKGHQIIIATHSPFLINAVKPQNILMLIPSSDNCTTTKSLRLGIDGIETALRVVGIENIYLYFARNIILVEGETEEEFIRVYHRRTIGKEPISDLVKIINVDGIGNVYGFSRAIAEIHDPNRIHMLHDNEISEDTAELIERLSIPETNRYILGTKEFEDAFEPESIYSAWAQYLTMSDRIPPDSWSIESIAACKEACLADDSRKFSKELRALSAGSGRKMTKPIFGGVLAEYVDEKAIPDGVNLLLRNLDNAISPA